MPTTKYIIDNSPLQTINGDITINGNLSVTGVTSGSLAVYKGLLTQTAPITGFNLSDFNLGFIIGETYTIANYSIGDDFSNIANVQSGIINQTGCVFIATGQTPINYSNGSELISSGNLVVDVLENNLGYDIVWSLISPGTYVGINNTTGPIYNNFNRNNTSLSTQLTTIGITQTIQLICQPGSYTSKDDVVFLGVWDFVAGSPVDNSLYYTPIEIQVKNDLDTTPVIISGTVVSSFPFNYVSVDLVCNGNNVESFYGDNTTVNNMSELVVQLNTNQSTSYLGTYSEDGLGGVLLEMPTNLVNQFCSNGTLSFQVFAD